MAPNTPAQNPLTWKPGQNEPTAQNRRPLITKMKSPSVRIVAGSVRITRIGRMIALTKPSTIATSSAVRNESTVMDEKTYGNAISAIALMSHVRSNRIASSADQ